MDFLGFYFPVYSLVFVSIETVFHQLSKHLEFREKYFTARRIFNFLLDVFDISYPKLKYWIVMVEFCTWKQENLVIIFCWKQVGKQQHDSRDVASF